MDDNTKKQDRREFIIETARKAALGGLAALGISLGYKNLTSDKQTCEVNLPCRRCFKLGKCTENIAINTRKEIRGSHSGRSQE